MKDLPQARKQPRQARSQHMVEVILEAAARVLAERGYAKTNTNLVAERAGVSVGSVYQYYPHKDALVTALHERHAAQMDTVIDQVFDSGEPRSLADYVRAMVRAMVAAHQIAPDLHRVLENEFPFFDAPKDQSLADGRIFARVRKFLEENRELITQRDVNLATWTVLQILESMVHAAVIDAPKAFKLADIENAITQAVVGYLTIRDH